MGCCGDREKLGNVRAEQKWDYINLSDFKSTSCWTGVSYAVLWITLGVSVAVYAVDTFTAINLIAFDRWSGQVKPAIPFDISRWIFAVCIILSFILLFYRWARAIKVMKGGGVAQSYLDPLALRIQSIRIGDRGRGYRRFLVFAELTKSKKGADYVAIFAYYSFEAWLRICFAEGPRQVVNGITLYSVMKLNLIPEGDHAAKDGDSPVLQFFHNIGVLADHSHLQAIILFGMLFTVVIWLISAISLAVSVVLYLLFLWHHIPSSDGSLKKYCRRKINDRAEKVINLKMKKALDKENRMQMKDNKIEIPGQAKRQPTLPVLETQDRDKLPEMPMLSRNTTNTTLPAYSASKPPSINERAPTLPDLSYDNKDHKRPHGSRTDTMNSTHSTNSYGSDDAPLLSSANDMGYSDRSPISPPGYGYGMPPMNRNVSNMSSGSQGPQRPYPSSRGPTPQGRQTPVQGYPPRGPPPRSNTGMSNMSMASTGRRPTPGPGQPPMDRSYTPATSPPDPNSSWPLPSQSPEAGGSWPLSPTGDSSSSRAGPTPVSGSAVSRNPTNGQGPNNFVAFNPALHGQSGDANPAPTSSYGSRGAYRGVGPSSNANPGRDYFPSQPSMPMPPPNSAQHYPSNSDDYTGAGYDDFLDDYAEDPVPVTAPVAAMPKRPKPSTDMPAAESLPYPSQSTLPYPSSSQSQSKAQPQSRVQMPPRAATSSPVDSRRRAPPRSNTDTSGGSSRTQYQAQSRPPPPSQQPTIPQLQQPTLPNILPEPRTASPVQTRSQTPTQYSAPRSQTSTQYQQPQYSQPSHAPRSQAPQYSQQRTQTPVQNKPKQVQAQAQPKPPSPPAAPAPTTATPAAQQGSGTQHKTLKEQLAEGGSDWRANDGSAGVQGGGSTGVFDW